jgi:hypothetical protein
VSIVVCGIGPDAGETWDTLGGDSEVGAGADQDLFKAADEFNDSESFAGRIRTSLRLIPADGGVRRSISVAAQIEDGIANDLAGTVESDVATAVAFEEFNTALGQEPWRSNYVGSFRVAAERDDRRVFEQKENVSDFFFFAERD